MMQIMKFRNDYSHILIAKKPFISTENSYTLAESFKA